MAKRSAILGPFWRSLGASLLLVIVLAAVGACSLGWRQEGETCVRESPDQEQRVTNYTDPELCERPVKKRPPDRLRVPPGQED